MIRMTFDAKILKDIVKFCLDIYDEPLFLFTSDGLVISNITKDTSRAYMLNIPRTTMVEYQYESDLNLRAVIPLKDISKALGNLKTNFVSSKVIIELDDACSEVKYQVVADDRTNNYSMNVISEDKEDVAGTFANEQRNSENYKVSIVVNCGELNSMVNGVMGGDESFSIRIEDNKLVIFNSADKIRRCRLEMKVGKNLVIKKNEGDCITILSKEFADNVLKAFGSIGVNVKLYLDNDLPPQFIFDGSIKARCLLAPRIAND